MKTWKLAVYDINGNRLCPLFDSTIEQIGDAYSIKKAKELHGWKELSFSLSRLTSASEYNYRFDFIKAENLVYLWENDECDVYCIKEPDDIHDSSKAYVTVTCVHISSELKTKNLQKYFDDENGIDTCGNLIYKAIAGTGWSLGLCDRFLEADGITEKIRSYSCDTKTGAYNMITEICKLFNARPVFHGATKTIDIHSIYNSNGWMEVMFGKNTDKIKRSSNTDSLITRLYVEGEYGDYGYVGIDSVNPTGLPFILNFEYYKQLGLFTDKHQETVDRQTSDYKHLSDNISEKTTEKLKIESRLSELIGNYGYIYYPVSNGSINHNGVIAGNSISKDKMSLTDGDVVAKVMQDGDYDYVNYPLSNLTGTIAILKFDPTITGLLAAYEDIEESAANNIVSHAEKIDEVLAKNNYNALELSSVSEILSTFKSLYDTDDLSEVKAETFDVSNVDKQYLLEAVLDYVAAIGQEENNIADAGTKKKSAMLEAINCIKSIAVAANEIRSLEIAQIKVEGNFNTTMGSMLRDGYWSDENYTVGQEQSLYDDALAVSKKMAFPIVTYSAGVQNLARLSKYKDEEFDIAQTIHMYDPLLEINDYGIVSKLVEHPDAPLSDSVEICTDVLDVGSKSFASILERVAEMAEKVRQSKDIYERAAAISKDGTIKSDLLEGAIDVLKTKLLSSTSNWRTDDSGNIVLEALDGSSAMMLCGSGFMCANSKTDNGWNWRTFGTGDGFTADMIIAGYLAAERIQAGSISVSHLSPNIGSDIDLTKNTSIKLLDGKIALMVSDKSTETQLVLTEDAIRAISENIYMIAEKINAIADEIDFSGNQSIRLSVLDKNATFYRDTPPTTFNAGDTWIDSTTGKTYLAHGMTGKNSPDFDLDDSFYLSYNGEGEYLLEIDEDGNMLSDYEGASLDDDGMLSAYSVWNEIAPVELHTSYINIEQERIDIVTGGSMNIAAGANLNVDANGNINVGSDGNINVGAKANINVQSKGTISVKSGANIDIEAGGTLSVDSGAAHFRTGEYTLSILASDGSEDTVMDFDSESKVLRVSEVEATNMRPFISGTTRVYASVIGGLDGLRGLLESAQYEYIIYIQDKNDTSSVPVEFVCCDSLRVDIIANEVKRVPPMMFRNITGNIYMEKLKWSCAGKIALDVDSGNYVLRDCYATAETGLYASKHARVVWIGADETMTSAGACTTAANATEGGDIRLNGLMPTGSLTQTLGGVVTALDAYTSDKVVEEEEEETTVSLNAIRGYYGTRNKWHDNEVYQGYSDGKGKIYGCLRFDFPDGISTLIDATLTLYRNSDAGRGSAADVAIYTSATDWGYEPELLGDPIVERVDAVGPGASCTLNVTDGIKAILGGTAKQLVLYTGETTTATGKVYSKQQAKFDRAVLKITY